jgi:hypothetical protein
MRSSLSQLGNLTIALVLGYFLFLQTQFTWTKYWLLKDYQQGMAVVTKETWSGHNKVDYKYVVGQKEYTGRSYRNWEDPVYSQVRVGGESVVFFSASHPWLSLLYKPHTVVEGIPALAVAVILELFAIVSLIRPKSKWAFSSADKKTTPKAA